MNRAAAGDRIRRLGRVARGPTITANLMARVGALAALTTASLLVARTGGPAAVGTLALLRVLPWFAGLLLSSGLYGAAPYFLSGPGRADPRYRPTLPAMAATAGVLGAGLWVALAPVVGPRFFPALSSALVLAAGITIPTQLMETTAKACSQGFDDLAGSNRIIFLEELVFVPLYGVPVAAGVPPYAAMLIALPVGDVLTATAGWIRLRRRGFFRGAGRPSLVLARKVAGYGARAQVGSIVLLLNARLDFAVVTALVGPSALGVYAVASRFAELLRLPALAINYVLYPAYARLGAINAAAQARDAIRRTSWVPAAAAVPVAAAAPVVLPLLYGPAFRSAVVPTWILLAGLAGGGVYGVMSAFQSGAGHPGLNSFAQGVGLVVTVALDLALIPHTGIVGAAIASALAYLTTVGALVVCFRRTSRAASPPETSGSTTEEAPGHFPGGPASAAPAPPNAEASP
ncbi:oligosaccharide flippase family protein [Streptomyces sp. TLI_185]|uniref:oligosaccharide flippase family protein n=1 Tax=Streptomyces sp. TLI_185 TaxID=2485151 RepID=UPI000F507E37|nr:oligosaccharide flippase family protein [Streptomyces sp. TLI_185]RPF38098.1 O-antigen/teichoic acid export membrane protein [Streptomyces sp. TLI_185]